jgi:hypothetical protein
VLPIVLTTTVLLVTAIVFIFVTVTRNRASAPPLVIVWRSTVVSPLESVVVTVTTVSASEIDVDTEREVLSDWMTVGMVVVTTIGEVATGWDCAVTRERRGLQRSNRGPNNIAGDEGCGRSA